MSYQVGSTCYDSPSAANQASVSSHAGSIVLVGGQSQVLSVVSVDSSSVTYGYTPLSGGALTSQTVALSPQPCNLLTAQDAVQISWMIAALWLAVYAITFVTNYLKNETFGASNDA